MSKKFNQYIILIFIVLLAGTYYLFPKEEKSNVSFSNNFTTNTKNFPDAKQPEIIELHNGDSYNLTTIIVKKKINGSYVKMLAYNGSIPGPLIRVPQNAEITINFKNQTNVETTLHSHGVRLANRFDGVPDLTQKAIKPGKTFTYKLHFPDPGVYWYHPHLREDYAQELGLYGNFIVDPANKTYWAEVDREVALFLDDILIQNGAIAPFNKTIVNHTLREDLGMIC
jgi:cbb3-type cytochrome oxidase subunit 3